MGCTQGVQKDVNKSLEIDRHNRESFMKDSKVIRLLLLGAGESGKSTFFKQITTIHGQGFDEEDRMLYVPVIVENVITSMRILIKNSEQYAEEEPEKDTAISLGTYESKEFIDELTNEEDASPLLAYHIGVLWADDGIKNTWHFSSQFQIPESIAFFFDQIDRICAPNFVPSYEDIIRVRLRTTGIVEATFDISDQTFCLLDVGGQRNERRKWMNCFDNVACVLFVVSMISYDQQLYEDVKQNRMDEALDVFRYTLDLEVFKQTPIVVFFNKKDLFEERLQTSSIRNYFEEYDGPDEYEESADYLVNRFMELSDCGDREITTHITCATDQHLVGKVFDSVKKNILSKALERLGYDGQVA